MSIQYKGLDVNEVKLLTHLILHGLDQEFVKELFDIEEIKWFLRFISNKKINKLIEWINNTYIPCNLQEIAFQINENKQLHCNLNYNDYSYFGYIQWLLKYKNFEFINRMIDCEIDLSHEYNFQHYMTADDIIDLIRNSEIHEFNTDDEDTLIDKFKDFNLK